MNPTYGYMMGRVRKGGILLMVTQPPWLLPWTVEEVGEFPPLTCARPAVGKWCSISLFLEF